MIQSKLLYALALSHTSTAEKYGELMHFTQLQRLLPQRLLCQVFGWLAERSNPLVRRPLIGLFRRVYAIDMQEYEHVASSDYSSFNDFFTRRLKAHTRPISPTGIVSPVDGTFSLTGNVDDGRLLQAKGRYFSLRELLANSASYREYEGAAFATIYLAPHNYHRVHVPLDSSLKSLTYVPGCQFSVNKSSALNIPNIYARNERIIAEFSSPQGDYCLIMVGALLVAGMSTVVTGKIRRLKKVTPLQFSENKTRFHRGDEFGAFQMGSTVIMLFPVNQQKLVWGEHAVAGKVIRLGETIGTFEKANRN